MRDIDDFPTRADEHELAIRGNSHILGGSTMLSGRFGNAVPAAETGVQGAVEVVACDPQTIAKANQNFPVAEGDLHRCEWKGDLATTAETGVKGAVGQK